MAASWEKLDEDLLVDRARPIKRGKDCVTYAGVSSIPLLMLTPRDDGHIGDFYDPSNGTTQLLTLLEVSGKNYFSSKGCLILIGLEDLSVDIFNMFSGQQLRLPPLEKIERCWCLRQKIKRYNCRPFFVNPTYARRMINKCVLSSNNLFSPDYTMMIIHGIRGELSYVKAGDESWTTINTWSSRYQDITYYKGQFFAVNCRGKIWVCNTGGDNPNEVKQVAQLPVLEVCAQYYMVESAGALLVVRRFLKEEENGNHTFTFNTSRFKVYDVDLSANTCNQINNLGDRVLFLGRNSSFSCAAHLSNLKPNSIYFTVDYFDKGENVGEDMGIYSLQDESISRHFISGNSIHPVTPPTWIEPSFV